MSFELPPEQTGPAAWYGPDMAQRNDWLMPLSAAEVAEVEAATDALARAWPEARYVVVPDAGHSALEPGIRAALVNATESFRLTASEDLFAPRFPWEA